MGNSADRAWQLSQLVEGVLTACNPSHGSLSCVETNCVSFASAQARKLNRSVCFSFPHEVSYFVGTPTMAGHCVSKQVGLPTARFPLAGSLLLGRRARRARFPTCGVVHVAGYSVVWACDPTPILPLKSTKRSAATILGRSAPSLLFHGALRNILLPTGFPATIHMIELEQTFANDSLQKISLAAAASESNRFYPVFLPHNHFYGAPGAGAAADLQDGRRVAVYLCGRDAEPCHEHLLFCEISKYVAGIKSK